jgi:hypothetical protein
MVSLTADSAIPVKLSSILGFAMMKHWSFLGFSGVGQQNAVTEIPELH